MSLGRLQRKDFRALVTGLLVLGLLVLVLLLVQLLVVRLGRDLWLRLRL